jgi:uncharacterized protein
MNGALTLGAALLLGLAASGHCLLMCGGISAALGIATAKDANGRTRPIYLLSQQLGRITSYALAGLLLSGIFGGLISLLDIEAVRRTVRVLAALALLLAALVAFGALRDPGAGVGRVIWPKLAPLGRRFFPVNTLPRAFGFGMVWGWMPCGFVYSVLLIATLQMNASGGALTMAAFGFGTAPALLLAAFGGQKLRWVVTRPATRIVAGTVLLLSATLTSAGPWLEHSAPALHAWLPFDCGIAR